MNYLIIGLGSMGKRRIRCLQALGYSETEIAGFDIREDRRQEAESKYRVNVYDSFEKALQQHNPDACIISVPPELHHIYMQKSVENDLHFFVEASVLDTNFEKLIAETDERLIIGVPSATMLFHPAIKKIKQIIDEGELGKICNITFHSGQYLPDWHTYEEVSDFYVSNKETGGAREILPFELTWITSIFGFPQRLSGVYKKTINIQGAEEIDDTYSFILDYDSFLINGLIDVVSRSATRKLLINGNLKQLVWDWNKDAIEIFDPENNEWEQHSYSMKEAEEGYDPRIGENMYIDEVRYFIDAVNGNGDFPNSLEEDHKVLKMLYAIEKASNSNSFVQL